MPALCLLGAMPVTATVPILACGNYRLELDRPAIMAILNVTGDSFSGDGLVGAGPAALFERAETAVAAGAAILDVGGESSRPGAAPVSEKEELARVLPAIELLRPLGVPISVDTTKPGVMAAAIAAGASLINDINGFRALGAVEVVACGGAGVCVMHMQGTPQNMQLGPTYGDVVAEVVEFLAQRVAVLDATGIDRERICVDPGFGFGKSLDHNLQLLRHLDGLESLGLPVLVGLSRKSMLGTLTGQPVDQRVIASVAAALMAVERGARIVRTHDVAATREALLVWEAVAGLG